MPKKKNELKLIFISAKYLRPSKNFEIKTIWMIIHCIYVLVLKAN